MAVELPAPRLVRRGLAHHGDPVKPFAVLGEIPPVELPEGVVQPHYVPRQLQALGAERGPQEREGGRALFLVHLGEGHPLADVKMLVHPLPPFRVVDRKAGPVALRGGEGSKEVGGRPAHRLGRDAGRTPGEEPGLRPARGGDAAEGLGEPALLSLAGLALETLEAGLLGPGGRKAGRSHGEEEPEAEEGGRHTMGVTGDEKSGFGADKPDSVPRLAALRSSFLSGRPCGRPARAATAEAAPARMRHTRGYRAGRPATYFALHRKGFFVPPRSRGGAVGSYPTFSLSPGAAPGGAPPGYLFSVTLSVGAP